MREGLKLSNDKNDIFIQNNILPNPSRAFSIETKNLNDLNKDEAIVVLDTNVLLIPFNLNNKTLEEIKNVYKKINNDDRLFIPGQVAREYIKNKPTKIGNIYKNLNDKKSEVKNTKKIDYPVLEVLESYDELKKIEEELNESIKKFKKKIAEIADEIKDWGFNDPVTEVYKSLFSNENIIEFNFEQESKKDIVKDLKTRNKHKIPPGYKDSGKSDLGIGDLLIWKTIIQISNEFDKNIIFITHDQKTDWWHNSNNKNLYPRYELIEEFQRETDGKQVVLTKLTYFLNLYDVDQQIIENIEEEENKEENHSLNSFIEVAEHSIGSHNKHLSDEYKIIEKMKNWFWDNYKDPADGVPYSSQEGGYQYFNGGPYSTYEVLFDRYHDLYDGELIKKAVSEIEHYGVDWVKMEDY